LAKIAKIAVLAGETPKWPFWPLLATPREGFYINPSRRGPAVPAGYPRPGGTPARRESSTGVDGAGRAGSASRPPGSSVKGIIFHYLDE